MITIYHNPRCGKSREGVQILHDAGCDFEVVKYLDEKITKDQLVDIIKKLEIKPIDLVRKNETIWKENFQNTSLSDDEIVNIMIENPILIERPIIINGNKAVVGRPPYIIKTIL